MSTAAIIVAAGTGQRFGHTGKSFARVRGKPMAWWSLLAATEAKTIDEVVLVAGEHSFDAASSLVSSLPTDKPIQLVLGGSRRQDSSLAGIDATSAAVEIVAIHDAARPLVTSVLFDEVVAAAIQHGAAIAAVPVSDTIKRIAGNRVVETIPREELVSVQTPQAFNKRLLLAAFTDAEQRGLDVTDEASLIEHMGGTVQIVTTIGPNMKVTYPDDLAVVEALMAQVSR